MMNNIFKYKCRKKVVTDRKFKLDCSHSQYAVFETSDIVLFSIKIK